MRDMILLLSGSGIIWLAAAVAVKLKLKESYTRWQYEAAFICVYVALCGLGAVALNIVWPIKEVVK